MREEIDLLFRMANSRKQRCGSSGFLVYAKFGEIKYVGGGTKLADTINRSRLTVVAGLYHFDSPGFVYENFVSDCEAAIKASVKLTGRL